MKLQFLQPHHFFNWVMWYWINIPSMCSIFLHQRRLQMLCDWRNMALKYEFLMVMPLLYVSFFCLFSSSFLKNKLKWLHDLFHNIYNEYNIYRCIFPDFQTSGIPKGCKRVCKRVNDTNRIIFSLRHIFRIQSLRKIYGV